MFMQIAIGAVGVAIALMVGYIVIAQVRSISSTQPANMDNATWGNITQGMDSAQTTIFAGFGLLAVGIIVLAAFGLIQIFQ